MHLARSANPLFVPRGLTLTDKELTDASSVRYKERQTSPSLSLGLEQPVIPSAIGVTSPLLPLFASFHKKHRRSNSMEGVPFSFFFEALLFRSLWMASI